MPGCCPRLPAHLPCTVRTPQVSPHAQCQLKLTVLEESSSGNHTFSISGVVVSSVDAKMERGKVGQVCMCGDRRGGPDSAAPALVCLLACCRSPDADISVLRAHCSAHFSGKLTRWIPCYLNTRMATLDDIVQRSRYLPFSSHLHLSVHLSWLHLACSACTSSACCTCPAGHTSALVHCILCCTFAARYFPSLQWQLLTICNNRWWLFERCAAPRTRNEYWANWLRCVCAGNSGRQSTKALKRMASSRKGRARPKGQ